ncbi:MAG: hypothetical protein ACKO5K_06550 [Armatimonadota bacterium]
MNDTSAYPVPDIDLDDVALSREPAPSSLAVSGPVLRLRNAHPSRCVWLTVRLPGAVVVPSEAAMRPGECATFMAEGTNDSTSLCWNVVWRHPAMGFGGPARSLELPVEPLAIVDPSATAGPRELLAERV